MKSEEMLKLIAEQSGLSIEGKGSKASAHGALLGFPVTATVTSLMMFGNQLNVDFGTAQPVEVKQLAKVLYTHKAKDKFFVSKCEEKESTGSMIAGQFGLIGGLVHGAVTAGKGISKPQPVGAFTLLITYGKESELEIIEKYHEVLAALEVSLSQMGITPHIFAGG